MKSFEYRTVTIALLLVGSLLLAGSSFAQPKPNVVDQGNRWLITGYFDCDAGHTQAATQGICFLPYERCEVCGIEGAWYSDTFPDWNGRYMQEGDRLVMHGDYAGGDGHDGMVIELFAGTSPRDEGAGQWTEWRETPGTFGTTIGFANARLRRVGRCDTPEGFASMSVEEVNELVKKLSAEVEPRMRTDGEPAKDPADPKQKPLPEEGEYSRK